MVNSGLSTSAIQPLTTSVKLEGEYWSIPTAIPDATIDQLNWVTLWAVPQGHFLTVIFGNEIYGSYLNQRVIQGNLFAIKRNFGVNAIAAAESPSKPDQSYLDRQLTYNVKKKAEGHTKR